MIEERRRKCLYFYWRECSTIEVSMAGVPEGLKIYWKILLSSQVPVLRNEAFLEFPQCRISTT
jgi:hypothetical protein